MGHGDRADKEIFMGINRQSDVIAELQIGPTDLGQVRIFINAPGVDLPMDFTPEEARDIAAELIEAAEHVESGASPRKRR